MSGKSKPNGGNDVVERIGGDQTVAKASLEGLLVRHFVDSLTSITSAESCLAYAREILGTTLPADRVAAALGYLSFVNIVNYAESTGRVEVNLSAATSVVEGSVSASSRTNG